MPRAPALKPVAMAATWKASTSKLFRRLAFCPVLRRLSSVPSFTTHDISLYHQPHRDIPRGLQYRCRTTSSLQPLIPRHYVQLPPTSTITTPRRGRPRPAEVVGLCYHQPAMLRRNSSRNNQRRPLGRSKSTNAIARNPVHAFESIDPRIAERDAHIAARLSYHRAQGSSSGDMPALSKDASGFAWAKSNSPAAKHSQYGLPRSDSVISRQETPDSVGALKRQQSVRFAGPNARPSRPLAARARGSRSSAAGDGLNLRVPGDSGRRSAAGSLRSYISELQPSGEYYTPEVDDVASMPSSCRKLRKSKSMFTPANPSTPEYRFQTGSAELTTRWVTGSRFSSLNKENEPIAGAPTPTIRSPKSAGFLRRRHEQTASQLSSHAENDVAVQLARDKFRQQIDQQSKLTSHPSAFFKSRFKSSESSTGLRKSLRNTSNNSAGLSSVLSGNSISVPKQRGLRSTARKVSRTLKIKLKGLFGKSNSTDELAAQADEQAPDRDLDGDSCLGTGEPPPPEEASMSRVASRIPSLHAVPSNQQMRSHQGSMESLEAEDCHISDDKSRVTSWTDSLTNTVTSQGTAGDRERQRLSMIRENGMHVSSSTVKRRQAKQEPSSQAATPASGTTIDSQRVYSALMKRLKETKQREDWMTKKSADNFRAHGIVPPRSSSVDRPIPQGWSPSTIRCVQPDDDVFQDNKTKYELEDSSPPQMADGNEQSLGSDPSSPLYKANIPPVASSISAPPGEASQSRVDIESPMTVSHRASAFFASPTYHTFRTASPFRRALRENMKAVQESQHFASPEIRQLDSLSALHLPERRPSASESDRDPRIACAESVYSPTTENSHIHGTKHTTPVVENFPEPPRSGGYGDATIFVGPRPHQPSPCRQREVSTASSVEWKTWLSANVSKIEDGAFGSPCSPPTATHVREHAEIDSPGEVLKPEIYNPWRSAPSTPLQTIEGNMRSSSAQRAMNKATDQSFVPVDENNIPTAEEDSSGASPTLCAKDVGKVPSLPRIGMKQSSSEGRGEGVSEMRSNNTVGPTSSSRLSRDDFLRRRSRTRLGGATSSVKSSPGLTAAVERQFRKVHSASPKTETRREPLLYTPRATAGASPYEHSRTPLTGPDLEAQVIGSQRMVDLFLNSRRRRVRGSTTGTGSEGSPAAFL